MHRLPRALRRARRQILARRRPLAAGCAAVAVLAVLQANAPPATPRATVLTAAHDLPAGAVIGSDDLVRTAFDPADVPDGMLRDKRSAVGRTTAVPVRRGEALTDVRLVTSSLLTGHPGLVAVPVRIGDPGVVRLLRVGDRVDLVSADPQGAHAAETVARDVPVLAIPRGGAQEPGLTEGALMVVGLPETSVPVVAQAAVATFLSVVLTR